MLKGTLRPTGNKEADDLVCSDALALFLGLILDQQIPIERAFSAPYLLKERLGHLNLDKILKNDVSLLIKAFSEKPALHRYPKAMAERFYKFLKIVKRDYDSNPENIWSNLNDAFELKDRLKALPGFSEHKARIAIAVLAKRYNIKPKSWKQASEPFSGTDVFLSAADVTSPKTLKMVRETKKSFKTP